MIEMLLFHHHNAAALVLSPSSQLLIFIQIVCRVPARKDAYKAAKVLDTCATQGDTHHTNHVIIA